MTTSSATLSLTLSDHEALLLETLAREYNVETSAEALHILLNDVTAFYDRLWDQTFANSEDVLERMAAEAHAAYLAGETEDFDPDTDPEAV